LAFFGRLARCRYCFHSGYPTQFLVNFELTTNGEYFCEDDIVRVDDNYGRV
jgi:hypothetical protein